MTQLCNIKRRCLMWAGSFLCLFLAILFISEKRHAEQTLSKLNNHSEIIASHLWKFDEDGTATYLSYASYLDRYSEATVFDFTGNLFAKAIMSDVPIIDRVLIDIGLLRESVESVTIYHRDRPIGILRVTAQNRQIYLYAYLFILLFLILLVILFIENLSATNQAQEEIIAIKVRAHRDSENRIRTILNAISDGIVALHTDGTISLANPGTSQILDDRSVIGKNLFTDFHLIDQKSQERITKDIVSNNFKNLNIRATFTPNTATDLKTIQLSLCPIYETEKSEAPQGYVCILSDISTQIKFEEHLRHSEKMDSIGQLAGGIAHDFNNMLGGIMGAAELLEIDLKEIDNSEAQENISLIKASASLAADLTKKLLQFSRKESYNKEIVPLNSIIKDTLLLLKRSINKRITIIDKQNCNLSIYGNASYLENALLNLAINARDAIPNEGTITITTESCFLENENFLSYGFKLKRGLYAKISISDNGVGMSQATMNKIFDPFFTTKSTGKGTGLGLASVYGAVVDHRGGISVDSKEGSGTTFTILLPAEKEISQNITEVSKVEDSEKNIECGTVLIVDDEVPVLTVTSKIVERMGYRSILATNSEEALKIVEGGTIPQLMIVDYIMPKMNGVDLYKTLLSMKITIPTIMITGFLPKKESEIISIGIKRVLQKPFSTNQLEEAINELLPRK